MVLLLAAVILLFLTCWSVIPAPALWLFPMAVGGPELAPWFIGAAIVIGLLGRKNRVVLLICTLSIFCSVVPVFSYLISRPARAAAFETVVPGAFLTMQE